MREMTSTELGIALCEWLEQQPGTAGAKASALVKVLSAMIGCAARDEGALLDGIQLAIDDLRTSAADVFTSVRAKRVRGQG